MEPLRETEFPPDLYSRFVTHFIERWINPEIQRRRDAKILSDDFNLFAAQVIMNFDKPTEVRLNEEVRAKVHGTFLRPFEKGAQVSIAELDSVTGIELTSHDPNAGHLTMLLYKGDWLVAFDFRYNAAICSDHLATARGFLDAARFSLNHQHLRVAIDNLYSATELMAKSSLLMYDKAILASKTHGVIHARFNKSGHLGNVSPQYTDLLNQLEGLRAAAKYFRGQFDLTNDKVEELLRVAEEMYSEQIMQLPRRTD